MVLFSKFGKTVKDLFKIDKYEFNRTVSLKCTSEKTEWTTEAGFPLSEVEETSAKLVFKHEDCKFGTVEATLAKTKPSKLDYKTPNLMEGLKVNLVAEDASEDRKFGSRGKFSLQAEYTKTKLSGKISAEAGGKGTLTGELATQIKGVWVGGEAACSQTGIGSYAAGMHYQFGDTQIDAKTDFEKYNLKMHKQYSSAGEVAAEYEMNSKNNESKISLGGRWTLDDKCTTQGFLTTNGDTFLLYNYKLSDRLTASLGTSLNLSNFEQENVNIHYKIEMVA